MTQLLLGSLVRWLEEAVPHLHVFSQQELEEVVNTIKYMKHLSRDLRTQCLRRAVKFSLKHRQGHIIRLIH